jgi:hypothetical protein
MWLLLLSLACVGAWDSFRETGNTGAAANVTVGLVRMPRSPTGVSVTDCDPMLADRFGRIYALCTGVRFSSLYVYDEAGAFVTSLSGPISDGCIEPFSSRGYLCSVSGKVFAFNVSDASPRDSRHFVEIASFPIPSGAACNRLFCADPTTLLLVTTEPRVLTIAAGPSPPALISNRTVPSGTGNMAIRLSSALTPHFLFIVTRQATYALPRNDPFAAPIQISNLTVIGNPTDTLLAHEPSRTLLLASSNYIAALDFNGTLLYNIPPPAYAIAPAALSPLGLLLLSTSRGLYALAPNGSTLWVAPFTPAAFADFPSAPIAVGSVVIFVRPGAITLFRVADGALVANSSDVGANFAVSVSVLVTPRGVIALFQAGRLVAFARPCRGGSPRVVQTDAAWELRASPAALDEEGGYPRAHCAAGTHNVEATITNSTFSCQMPPFLIRDVAQMFAYYAGANDSLVSCYAGPVYSFTTVPLSLYPGVVPFNASFILKVESGFVLYPTISLRILEDSSNISFVVVASVGGGVYSIQGAAGQLRPGCYQVPVL